MPLSKDGKAPKTGQVRRPATAQTTVKLIREEVNDRMRKTAIAFCLLFGTVCAAQDTVVFQANMQVVDIVRAHAIKQGVRTDVVDPVIKRLYPAGTLSDLLGNSGSLQLKSYGPGGLATTSSRGANSMQTPVIWNGINLQNITNNTVDLSLLPTFLFDDISFQPGSTSSAWGSGTIGGAIKTNSNAFHVDPSGKKLYGEYVKAKAVCEFGSYGAVMTGVQFGLGIRKWNYDLKLFEQVNENRFPFENIAKATNPQEILQHGRIRQHGFLTQISYGTREDDGYGPNYRGSKMNLFSARLWVQETKREIPPTMLQTSNESKQQDYAMRATADWTYSTHKHFTWITRAAAIHEGLVYDPGFMQVVSNTTQWSFIAGSEFYKNFRGRNSIFSNEAFLSGGINAAYSSAIVTEYVPLTTQWRTSAFISYGKAHYLSELNRYWSEFNITLRQEMVDDKFIDPVGSVWYYLRYKKSIGIRACVSHNYRVPTFNDLYWVPGGNPDLRAETSWTEEITLELKHKWEKSNLVSGTLDYAITVYNRDVVDMITWAPYSSYWSPKNIARVKSKGMEHRFKAWFNIRHWELTFLANVDYVRSTYEKTERPDDVAICKQLIYVPAWFGGASLNVKRYDYFFTYSHQYTDLRFTTRDHVEWLPAYNIANVAIGWSTLSTEWTLHSNDETNLYRIDLFLRCNNVFNVQYQTVAWRPMPGRCFTIGCTIDFVHRIFTQRGTIDS